MKCKDFYIIKFRWHADKHIMKNWREPENHKIFTDRIKDWHNFEGKIKEYLSGHDKDWWMLRYPTFTEECWKEYLEDEFGIYLWEVNAHRQFWIPRKYKELFDWLKENSTVPYKVLKKSSMGNIDNPYREPELNYWRDESTKVLIDRLEGKNKDIYETLYKDSGIKINEIKSKKDTK